MSMNIHDIINQPDSILRRRKHAMASLADKPVAVGWDKLEASPYHQQQLPASQQQQQQQPQTVSPTSTTLNSASDAAQPANTQQPQPPGTFQTLRLRDEQPPVVTPQPAPRASRKRKSPSTATQEPQAMPPPPPGMHPPPPGMLPPHFMAPPMPPPHGYQYVPGDYTPGGMPPPPPPQQQQGQQMDQGGAAGRQLSQSKRAEQNRKAQRAFRERRDQHVKALESRSQLLDAALASADEANRRWEDCRALVDQLRVENAALRAELQRLQGNGQMQTMPPLPPGLEQILTSKDDNASQENGGTSNAEKRSPEHSANTTSST